jgi:hypothetical protein
VEIKIEERSLEKMGLPYAQTCFLKPPTLPYLVYTKSDETIGGDDTNLCIRRDISIEIYSAVVNDELVSNLCGILDGYGVAYTVGEWVYVQSEKMFYCNVDFEYILKNGYGAELLGLTE